MGHKSKSRRYHGPLRRLFTFRPVLENLEDRRLLAAGVASAPASNDNFVLVGSPDTSSPVFSNVQLGGHDPASSFQVTLGEALGFSGLVSDNVGLSQITIKVTSPKVTDFTVLGQSVSGTSRSLTSYGFNTSNSTYAGVTGNYTVALWVKDTSGNTSSKVWNFYVAPPPDTSSPVFSNVQLGGHDPASSFQVTLGEALGFSGLVSDNVGLSQITIKVTSPKVTDFTVLGQSVSGTSRSLSEYSFDAGNPTYAGAQGTYWVTLFAKDIAGNVSSQTWSFYVAAFVTQIPTIMENMDWQYATALQRRWFASPAKVQGEDILSMDNTTITMDWVLEFQRAEILYEEAIRVYANNAALPYLEQNIEKLFSEGATSIEFGNFTIGGKETDSQSTNERSMQELPFVDELTGALGAFQFVIVPQGTATKTPNGVAVTITKVGVYVRDSFDFNGDQSLGYWKAPDRVSLFELSGYTLVENTSYRSYRDETGIGGDFWVYSDIKWKTLDQPDAFTLTPPTFEDAQLGGHSPVSSFRVDEGETLNFHGAAFDDAGLSQIEIKVTSPKVTDYTLVGQSVSGMSHSLSDYSFGTGNPTYAGVPGTYWVTVFAKDTAGKVSSQTWNFNVAAPDGTAPTLADAKLGGRDPASSFQVTLGDALGFSGLVSDNVGLSQITIKVTSPIVTDFTVLGQSVSGTSRSLSEYSFDTSNSTYAGVTGNYTVAFWVKDTSGNTSSKVWNFYVAPSGTIVLSDGFDYPIGSRQRLTEANDGDGWYSAQDFGVYNDVERAYHLGEDWDSEAGGNSDLDSPVYSVANGTIVYAGTSSGWGKVLIVRHSLSNGTLVESLYGHLQSFARTTGDVIRGERIGAIGDGDGLYAAHLHLELRDSTSSSWGLPGPGYSSILQPSGWFDPSDFVDSHRPNGMPNHPPAIDDQGFSVPENTSNGTLVGTIAATDPDGGQSLSFAITGGNIDDAFSINRAGQIHVANGVALDFESLASFVLTVQASDNGTPSLSDTAAITINLNNLVEQTPAITGISTDTGTVGDQITRDGALLVHGTGEPGMTEVLYLGGSQIGTAPVNGSGAWTFDYRSTSLADGQHLITATARDAFGNESAPSASFVVTIDTQSPTVESFHVQSSDWTSQFFANLASAGLGAAGFSVPILAGSGVPLLPWTTLDKIVVKFSEDVSVDVDDLVVRGVNIAQYATTSGAYHYDPGTQTATWLLPAPIAADKLLNALSSVTDIAGNQLTGPASFRVDVIPGDADANGGVNFGDYLQVRSKAGQAGGAPGYTPRFDLTGNGVIDLDDAEAARTRVGTVLPSGPAPPPEATFGVALAAVSQRTSNAELASGGTIYVLGPQSAYAPSLKISGPVRGAVTDLPQRPLDSAAWKLLSDEVFRRLGNGDDDSSDWLKDLDLRTVWKAAARRTLTSFRVRT